MSSSSSVISSKDAVQKKKLQKFLREMVHFGTLRGFKHFSCYVRGKEELLITVNNKLPGSSNSSLLITSSAPAPVYKKPLGPTDSFSSSNLPYDKSSLVLSYNTQVCLNEKKEEEVGLPPASPSEDERKPEADVTLFLIAGYARYCCPYVWVRSNHERLFRLSGDQDEDKDSPLRLKSTARWKDEDVRVTEIVGEIVKLCTFPAPRNPFEIDLDYFSFLSQPDQLLASAAMATWLQKILLHTPDSKAYIAKVYEELQLISRFHFNSLREVTLTAKLPIFQQLQRKRSQQTHHQEKTQGASQQITARPMSQVRPPQVNANQPSYQNNLPPPSQPKPQVQKLPLSRQPAVGLSGSAAPPLAATTPTLNSPAQKMPTTPLLLVTPPNKSILGPTLPTTSVQHGSSDAAPLSRPLVPKTAVSTSGQHLPVGFPPTHPMSTHVQQYVPVTAATASSLIPASVQPQSIPVSNCQVPSFSQGAQSIPVSNSQVPSFPQGPHPFPAHAPLLNSTSQITSRPPIPALSTNQQNAQTSHMPPRPQEPKMAPTPQQNLHSFNHVPATQPHHQFWGQAAMQPSQPLGHAQRPFYQPSPTAQPATPSNPAGAVRSSGSRGAFPGGFERMPAPSML